MLSNRDRNQAGDFIPLIVADVFELAGAFRRVGDQIAAQVGQTQARWQVMSAASTNDKTVPQIARRLGYARQSVQRTADRLVTDRLAEYAVNPDHKKSPLLLLTPRGQRALATITDAAAQWHENIAARIDPSELEIALRVLRGLCSAVELAERSQQKR